MLRFKDIEQKTDAWFRIKHGKVGGTLASGLFVKSDTLFFKILSQHEEDYVTEDEGYINSDMQRGNYLEPFARERMESDLNLKFIEYGWLQHDTIKILGISPDGLTEDGKDACEIKAPSASTHSKYVYNDEFPKEYWNQLIHSFTVNEKLERLHFCSFRPKNKRRPLFIKTMTRDTVLDFGSKTKPNLISVKAKVTEALSNGKKLEERVFNELNKF